MPPMSWARALLLVTAALLPGCATLSTSGMTPACRSYYNACLNTCPRPAPNGQPDVESAACVDRCNNLAKSC